MEQNKESRNKPMHYGQLIFDKAARMHNEDRTVSSINGASKTGYLHVKE